MGLIHYSKRGATSVFLTMILASILMVVSLFIHAASQNAGRSYADAVFDLAGRSVLSEYDIQLQKRYGIFAVHTDERQAEEKVRYYADYSFHNNFLKEALRDKNYIDLLKLELESVHVNLKGYSMTDTDNFEKQILDYMKYGLIKDYLSNEKAYQQEESNIELKNEQVISSLPSNGYSSNIFTDLKRIAENGLPSLKEIEKAGKDNFLVDEYIMRNFLNHRRGNETRDTFFSNEVEYLLKGNFNDQENYDAVRRDLFIMRSALNLIHISSDPDKQRQIKEIAAFLTIVKGEKVGEAFIEGEWAAAEAENDLRLLEEGKQVPLKKGRDNWAVQLHRSVEFIWKEDYIEPRKMNGYNYEEYLRILLFLENREKKLLRCMDLIQLNMKGSYNQGFDLKEYYGGFQFEAVAKERKFTYIQKF
ncbi:MAG TPA: DUF5702 domain-containing protein [Anaerovoracaceae bacterium]|nr:DUF5702 domain-containing protein [Anaerovoracaceae bacterium]